MTFSSYGLFFQLFWPWPCKNNKHSPNIPTPSLTPCYYVFWLQPWQWLSSRVPLQFRFAFFWRLQTAGIFSCVCCSLLLSTQIHQKRIPDEKRGLVSKTSSFQARETQTLVQNSSIFQGTRKRLAYAETNNHHVLSPVCLCKLGCKRQSSLARSRKLFW